MSNLCLPKNISYFQISRVFLEPIELWLRLDLVDPIEQKDFTLEFRDLMYFAISKTPEDDEGCYLIGDITFSSVKDVAKLLKELGYGFSKANNKSRRNFFHLHVEGDVCIDAVCGSYKIPSTPEA